MKGQFRLGCDSRFSPLSNLELKRECILEISWREFRDDDPCIIHETFCRNALVRRIMQELEKAWPEVGGKPVRVGQLPDQVMKCLDYDREQVIEFQ